MVLLIWCLPVRWRVLVWMAMPEWKAFSDFHMQGQAKRQSLSENTCGQVLTGSGRTRTPHDVPGGKDYANEKSDGDDDQNLLVTRLAHTDFPLQISEKSLGYSPMPNVVLPDETWNSSEGTG